jgi:rubrerythrin
MGLEFDFSKLDAMDILDIAGYVEKEAEANYEELGVWCRTTAPEVEAFFKRMAGWEARHRNQLIERRKKLFGDTPVRFTDSGVWGIETPDYDKVDDEMSVMDALNLALEAEKTAERYYSAAVEFLSDPETIAMFNELCKAEVQHQEMLKVEIAKH